jgi:prephenate dehydratase
MVKKTKVAYQGVSGAYSHLACLNHFGSNTMCIENETFEDAMELVENNDADFALIPIENKTAGRVDEFYGLIPNMRLQIVGEHYQKIEHCLLSVKGSSINRIISAYSHPQGLAQCRNTLHELQINPIAHFDTAGSAKEIAKIGDRTLSAIASSLAGEIYGLDIIKPNVQDQKDNFTRFIVLSKEKVSKIKDDKPCVTSIIFQVSNVSSALYKALGGFAKNRVNILKIESYIPLQTLQESHFHIDVDASIESEAMQSALIEVKKFTKKLKILGTYEKNPIRVF